MSFTGSAAAPGDDAEPATAGPRGEAGRSAAAWCLAFLIAAELFGRSKLIGVHCEQVRARAEWLARQAPAPLLVMGDSTAHEGIDAARLGASAGTRALNAAMNSGSPIVTRAIYGALPGAKPSKIVYGLSPLLFTDDWTPEPPEIEVSTLRERIDFHGMGRGVLETGSTFFRRRLLIWQGLLKRVRERSERNGPAERIDHAPPRRSGPGQGAVVTGEVEDPDGSYRVTSPPGASDLVAAQLWNRWVRQERPTMKARAQAMRDLAERWRADGIEVVYVLMPVTSQLRDIGRQHPEAWESSAGIIRELTHRLGGRLLDCRAAVSDAAFYDGDHMRDTPERGAFSQRLGTLIATGAKSCE